MMRPSRKAHDVCLHLFSCLVVLLMLAGGVNASCQTLCEDGSPIAAEFADVSALVDQPILGTLTCSEYQDLVATEDFNEEQCQNAHYIGVKKCGCTATRGFCDICEDGSVAPDLARKITYRKRCLDYAGEGFGLDASDERCPAYHNTVGLYCGCQSNTMSIPGACRICDEPGGKVVKTPKRPVIVRIKDGFDLKTECGELEFFGNHPYSPYTCQELTDFGKKECCAGFKDITNATKTPPLRNFPEEFNLVTCNYNKCLGELLAGFGEDLGDAKLNRYAKNAANVTNMGLKVMSEKGNTVVSIGRLNQAIKWIQKIGGRATKRNNAAGIAFATKQGDKTSNCASDLLSDIIDGLLGTGLVKEKYLTGPNAQKVVKAQSLTTRGNWIKSLKISKLGILDILDQAGKRRLPLCLNEA